MSTPSPLFQRIILGYRRQSQRSRALFWLVILLLLILIVPNALQYRPGVGANRARLYFPAVPQKLAVGEAFSVELRLQTTGTAINAVGTIIRFNPLYLQVVNTTTEKSFCSFYLDNTFDNIKGEIKISCGTSQPGFQGDSVVIHVNMRPKLAGDTQITTQAENTNVLANDGKGTNILQKSPNLDLTIGQLF
jgi:hypothetical protein